MKILSTCLVGTLGVVLAVPAQAFVYRAPAPVYRPAPVYHPAPAYRPAPVYRTPAPVYRSAPVRRTAPVYRSAVHHATPVHRPSAVHNFQARQPQYRPVIAQPHLKPGLRPNGIRPAVINPNPRASDPRTVAGWLPPRQIPSYRPARIVGGSVILGTGAFYYLNTDNGVYLVPSGIDNTGAPFDIEAFIRALDDDGTPPNDIDSDDFDPDNDV
jgi:hypothetical protein